MSEQSEDLAQAFLESFQLGSSDCADSVCESFFRGRADLIHHSHSRTAGTCHGNCERRAYRGGSGERHNNYCSSALVDDING